MNPPRPPNRSDGVTAVTATEEGGGDPPGAGAAGAPRSHGGGDRRRGHAELSGDEPPEPPEPQSRRRARSISPLEGLGVFQTRSIFHLPRRPSSGYFSSDGDSVPSSPRSPRPATADTSTQTPSPACQVMNHALQRVSEAHGGGAGAQQHGSLPSPFSAQQHHSAGDMQAVEVGRELRRIGDDFNNHLLEVAGRHPWVVIQPIRVPHVHQDPAVVLCLGLLLLVIGRILYSQAGASSHPQV
ncbi:bcl-2-like protein 11 [Betta splendens]|uniref:Bcl-2-like protein 11 n=1 Tax=Betta splendens TaxID=158456 RepID=A0A6P7KL88_BETSP|nr:bcl-2-like protein 11 [Betta splendens]